MLCKRMMALLVAASVAVLVPGVASARGGFGGGGSFHGGGFGGGFHSGGMGASSARFGSSAIAGNSFRSAAIGTSGAAVVRSGPLAANAFAPSAGVAPAFRSGGFHHGRGFAVGAFGVGLGFGLYGPYGYYDDYYDYPDYVYDDAYYDDGGCYIVQRRVLTPYGWRLRPVQICG